MLSTLNLKRAKANDLIESSDQSAIAVAPGAEESCPAPDTRTSREPSLRMEPRFTASSFSTPDFTAERIVLTAERIVPRVDAERLISRVDTERLTPQMDTERLTARTDSVFPSAEFPSSANDLGPEIGRVDDMPSMRLDNEPSAFAKAMKRALTGFVIVVGGAIATVGWQNFGDDAKQLAKGLTPNVPLVSWLHLKRQDAAQTSGAAAASATPAEAADASAAAPQDTPQAAETPPADSSSQQAATPPADQQAAPQQPAPQQAAAPTPAPAAPASTDTTATAAAAPSPDVTQLTQSVQALTREVAVLQKAMAEMKTSHEQMARDIAKLNTPRRTAAPRPATPTTTQAQRPASLPPVQSATTPRPVSQYQPPARPYPVSQEASATQPHSLAPPPSSNGPTVVYSQQPTSPPPSYTQPRTYYSDPSGYADSSPAPRPPASVSGY